MCLFPIRASLDPEGGRPTLHAEGELKLPCGKCHICISKRALEWSTRARHEISEHTENSFITLTYSDENLPSHFIIKSDFQKFIKRLRKKTNKKIRYMVSYEYGSLNYRPHFHAILFGYTPPNMEYLFKTSSGAKLYKSPELEKLWKHGFHSVGEANEKTAYYIASYALKGQEKELVHPETGEECTLRDSMNVSVRPAIGKEFFLKNYNQLVDSGSILPRYYRKLLEKVDPDLSFRYEEDLLTKTKTRSSQESYANIKIANQKIDVLSGRYDFRQTYTDIAAKTREFQERRLREDRDNYVSSIRRRIQC
jgi:hypothetical protein